MPRATWKGLLRLSLVTCPVFLAPATTRTKPIRLNQVWVPHSEPAEAMLPAPRRDKSVEAVETGRDDDEPEWLVRRDTASFPQGDPESAAPAQPTRIALRPHDPETGEEIERDEVVKGYEYERGKFVTLTQAELKALDIPSSRVIDLAAFVPRADIDPLYLNTPYYLYPEGRTAAETMRVIGAALAEAGLAGLGRLTLSRRERMVMVEPRGAAMLLITLRSADEVRAAEFGEAGGEIDAEAVAIAETIVKRRAGRFDPATFRDRYQDALRELIEAKMQGLSVEPKPAAEPPPVIDLMQALKRSLAEETGAAAQKQRRRPGADRRQRTMLLPVDGKKAAPERKPAIADAPARRRRKA